MRHSGSLGSGECTALLGHMFKEQDSVVFLVSRVFLHCLATRGTSKTALFSLFVSPFTAWSHVERAI